jgi:hypothetical protein
MERTVLNPLLFLESPKVKNAIHHVYVYFRYESVYRCHPEDGK